MDPCSLLIASAIALSSIPKAASRTIDYYDRLNQITERVLDRSICKDIERVQEVDSVLYPLYNDQQKAAERARAENRKKNNRLAVGTHCSNSPRMSNQDKTECNIVKRRSQQ